MLRPVLLACDRGPRQIRQRMPHEFRINSAISIKLFFEREDYQRFIHILAEQANPPLPPSPELRTYVIDHWNAAFFHLPRHPPVERRSPPTPKNSIEDEERSTEGAAREGAPSFPRSVREDGDFDSPSIVEMVLPTLRRNASISCAPYISPEASPAEIRICTQGL